MRLASAILCIACCTSAFASAREIPRKIQEVEAERFAEMAYPAGGHSFDYQEDMGHPFFVYYGLGKISSFGYFAVNPWTGDVWALWGCRKLSTPALRKSQAAVRHRFTREELHQYAGLSRLKPDCIVEN